MCGSVYPEIGDSWGDASVCLCIRVCMHTSLCMHVWACVWGIKGSGLGHI